MDMEKIMPEGSQTESATSKLPDKADGSRTRLARAARRITESEVDLVFDWLQSEAGIVFHERGVGSQEALLQLMILLDKFIGYWVSRRGSRTVPIFIDRVLGPLARKIPAAKPATRVADVVLPLADELMEAPYDDDVTAIILYGVAAVISSIRAWVERRHDLAIRHQTFAAWCAGAIDGAELMRRHGGKVPSRSEIMSSLGALGAYAKHRENRAMKQQVLEHYRAHSHEYPSKDSYAQAVAGVLVPATMRSVREWIKGA